MLESLETDAFINALRRFIARRGLPSKILSDNGTNFVGAKNELYNEKVQAFCTKENIEWIFNPPTASHMGGAWERQIRTIRKVITGLLPRNSRLTDEILSTLFCEVESIVNSRPLTKSSQDIRDASALTPAHLLIGRGVSAVVPGQFTQADTYRRRWKSVQHLANQFWQRYVKEYLPELQRRAKWLDKKPNIKTGDLVLILNENTPRCVWPVGLIVECLESKDDLIRAVRVKTATTELVRPIAKVVPLELNSAYLGN